MRGTQLCTSHALCKAVQACPTAPHIPPPTLPTPPPSPAGGCRADCGLHVLRRQRRAARRECAPPAAHRRPPAQVLCGVSWAGGHPPRLSHCSRQLGATPKQGALGACWHSNAGRVTCSSGADRQLGWHSADTAQLGSCHAPLCPTPEPPTCTQPMPYVCAPTVLPRLAAASATPR